MENKIKQTMASVLRVNMSEITDNSSVDNTENWDSLSHMNLILALEEEFKVEFDIEEIAAMINYKLILTIIREKMSHKSK